MTRRNQRLQRPACASRSAITSCSAASPRVSVRTGHVVGNVIQTMIAMAFVVGVALLLGFRPTAGPLDWIMAIGLLTMVTFALIWLAVALGMVTKSVETASNLPCP